MTPLVYVTIATKWQNINLVPALNIPPAHTLVVLLCRRGTAFEAENLVHAEQSVQNFIDAYKLQSSRLQQHREPRPLLAEGPVESVAYWRKRIVDLLVDMERGAPKRATIVFNYLGGPSDAKIGTWMGLDDLGQERPDLTIRRVAYSANGELLWRKEDDSESRELVVNRIEPDAWFALHGWLEPEKLHAARINAEKLTYRHRGLTHLIANACFSSQGLPSGWLVNLFCSIDAKSTRVDLWELAMKNKFLKKLPNRPLGEAIHQTANLIAQLDKRFHGVRVDETIISFEPATGLAKWLKTDWFEEYIYLLMGSRVGYENVALNTRLEKRARSKDEETKLSGTPATEIDVAVFGRSQMHVIECKAFTSGALVTSKSRIRTWVNQCLRLKNELVGPGGSVFGFTTLTLPKSSPTPKFAADLNIGLAWTNKEYESAADKIAMACR